MFQLDQVNLPAMHTKPTASQQSIPLNYHLETQNRTGTVSMHTFSCDSRATRTRQTKAKAEPKPKRPVAKKVAAKRKSRRSQSESEATNEGSMSELSASGADSPKKRAAASAV